VRGPHALARITAIDTSRVAALPGGHAVLTAADLVQHPGRITDIAAGTMHNIRFLRYSSLAAAKGLDKGCALAAVAATRV
jgi:CO/xanthine dehydrogenase Mo-binding subunit